ncbi:MAG TPA: hypothetical protein VIG61_08235 [Fusobacterium sp.]|uniref:hypothetical protein n=1 Tax=Fusobacterium sp. TaxID=68766 RepID=UPI002F428A5C
MNYLFFLLIPAGLSLLIISIKQIFRFVNTKKIYEMPCNQGEGTFTIISKGEYGLWISGKNFTRTPIGKISFNLVNQQTGKSVPLTINLLRTSISGFKTRRVELYIFRVEEGNYVISLNDRASIRDKVGTIIANAIFRKPVDYSMFFVQIREHISMYILVLCVFGIIFGSVMTISGIILPIAL